MLLLLVIWFAAPVDGVAVGLLLAGACLDVEVVLLILLFHLLTFSE